MLCLLSIWPRKANESIAARIAAGASDWMNSKPISALVLGGNEQRINEFSAYIEAIDRTALLSPISSDEVKDLVGCERVIRDSAKIIRLQRTKALTMIRDRRLYRQRGLSEKKVT